MIVGKRIKQLREVKGLTQTEFAEKLNVNRSMVAKYEAGTSSMGIETFATMCKALGARPDYMLGFSDTNSMPVQHENSADVTLHNTLLYTLSEQVKFLTSQIKIKDEEIARLLRQFQ